MALRKQTPLAKLVVGMVAADTALFDAMSADFSADYGAPDYKSVIIPFTYTDYYVEEMGKPLFRKFISFEKLIDPSSLPDIKIRSNRMEAESAGVSPDVSKYPYVRKINLDPGYLTPGKFVLASMKDNQHRIYLRDGVFAEVTLRYKHKTFQPWEWTFPDYRSPEYIEIINAIREIYRRQVKAENSR